MAAGYKPLSFRGNTDIQNVTTFESFFLIGEGAGFDSFQGSSDESVRPDNWPVFIRLQPDGLRFVLEVHINQPSQANLDYIKQILSPLKGRGWLLLATNNGESPTTHRRLFCQPEKVIAQDINIFKISMRATIGVFENESSTSISTVHITSSGQTFPITRLGSAPTQPVFTFTPKTLALNTANWIKYRNLVIVNRSEMPLYGPDGEEYPILIGDVSTWSITPGNDVRVLLDGEDLPRYFSGNKLWAGLQFTSRKTFTLDTTLTNSNLPNIFASNPDLFLGWPDSGYLVIDNECIQYSSIGASLVPVLRGALGTTAASHSIGATAYWLEHPTLKLIWDYTNAQAANDSIDSQPVIDLANSTNSHWEWPGPFFNNDDVRLAGWRKEYTDEVPSNPNTKYIRCYEEGGAAVFENALALAGKPLANNMTMEVPCALSLASAGVSLDQGHSGPGNIPIDGVSYEKKTVRTIYGYTRISTGETVSVQSGPDAGAGAPSLTYTKQALEQSVTAEVILSDTFPVALGSDAESTQYAAIWTGNYLEPVQIGTTDSFIYLQQENQVVPISVDRTTYTQVKSTAVAPPGPFSLIDQMVLSVYGVDKEGYEALITLGATLAVPVFRVRLNVGIPIGKDLEGNVFTESPIPIQVGTGNKTTIDNVVMNFDTNRTPRIIVGSETSLYMLNGRLKNELTGDYLDFNLPAQVDQVFQIDTANHTLIDLASGDELTDAISASNPRDWLYHDEGVNIYSFTMSGIGSGHGNIDIDETHVENWL